MTKKKVRKLECGKHSTDRDISFYYLDTRYNHLKTVEWWNCQTCEDEAQESDRRYEKQMAKEKEDQRIKIEKEDKKHYAYWAARRKSEEENIWDFIVENELLKGIKDKHIFRGKFPKELIRLKRAAMKFERLIKSVKQVRIDKIEQEKEKIKKEQEEIDILKRPLMECRKHGNLFIVDVIKGGKSRWTGEQRFKCRQCMKELHKDYYKRKKDYVLNKHAQYRANNPERVKEIKSKSWRKCNGRNKDNATIERESSTSI